MNSDSISLNIFTDNTRQKFDLDKLYQFLEKMSTEENELTERFNFFQEKDFGIYDYAYSFWENFDDYGGMPAAADADLGVYVGIYSERALWYDCIRGTWKNPPEYCGQNIFRIDENGVIARINVDDYSVKPECRVKNPLELLEFFRIVQSGPGGPGEKGAQSVRLADIIENISVQYFRTPDDWSRIWDNYPWIKVDKLQKIIGKHIKRSTPWLMPVLLELESSDMQEKVNNGTMKQGHANFAKGLIGNQMKQSHDLKEEMMMIAASLDESDILQEIEFWNTVQGDYPWTDRKGDNCWFQVCLKPEFYAPWFEMDSNPYIYAHIIQAVRTYLKTGDKKLWEKQFEVPAYTVQVQKAFETYCTRFQLQESGKRVADFPYFKVDPSEPANCLSWEEKNRILRSRYHLIHNLLVNQLNMPSEMKRALTPLPYFMERPFVLWERAGKREKWKAGLICLQQIIKYVSILTLDEALDNWMGHPELTQWVEYSRHSLIEHFEKTDWLIIFENIPDSAGQLPAWGPLAQTLCSRKTGIHRIIEQAEKIDANPMADHQKDLLIVEELLTDFFTTVGDALRHDCAELKMGRMLKAEITKKQFGYPWMEVKYENLCTDNDRFGIESFKIEEIKDPPPIDADALFTCRDRSFYQINRLVKLDIHDGDINDIMVFEHLTPEGSCVFKGLFTGKEMKKDGKEILE